MPTQKVYVGRKEPMQYVLAIITVLHKGEDVEVMARGRSISRAVDSVEILRRRFMPDVTVEKVEIGTDMLPAREGNGERPISRIRILIKQ